MAPHRNFLRRCAAVGLALTAAIPALRPASSVDARLTTEERRDQQREARLVIDLLQNYHYSDRSLSEIDTHELLKRFLDEIDPKNWFLLREDTDFVQQRFARSLKTVYLMRGDLQPAYEIFDLFVERAQSRFAWIDKRLGGSFDFTDVAVIPADIDQTRPVDKAEADRRWGLRIRDEVLSEIVAGRTQAAAVGEVRRRYEKIRRQLAATDALAVRERFFEVLIEAFDPHSGYFSADSAREFEVEMAGSVAGVGLELCKDDGFCIVAAITPGGPADLHGEIQAGDRIEAVAEGDGALVPTSGRRLREIVAIVRGPPKTKVRIKFRAPAAAASREVSLERTQVVLPWERARGTIYTAPDAAGRTRKIGCIYLPAFYAAGEKGSIASATGDMRELLVQMKAAGVEGLVVDIRDNPGGALAEAVSAAGLFLSEGTVLLTRELDGKVEEHKIGPPAAVYGGPLVVLTSSRSASASEIFAEAVKYHQRAVLAGAATTFGKGTVQSYIDLAKLPAGAGATAAAWGVLRLTTQRFYGPCGEAIQRTGARSDIVVPEYEDKAEQHEADLPHAFPAEAIAPPKPAVIAAGDFARVNEDLLLCLRGAMEKDQAVLPECLLWKKEIALWTELVTPKERSLQLAKRRKDKAAETVLRETLRRERRLLLDAAAFPGEPVETEAVRSVLAASENRMRQPLPDGTPRSGHLHGGVYCGELPGGRPCEIHLDAIDFRRFSGDAGALARAFSAGYGRPTDDATIAGILVELGLIEKRTDDAVFACFARNLGGPPADRAALVKGVDAFLRGLTEIDGELLRERPALDVPLRESLRLAAAWAARLQPSPAVDRAAAATTALSPNPVNSP